ncbi:MAG: transposase [Gemmatimonadota bacterium]|nr:transposase [Gemmatimonadota bacterium]
MSHTLFVRSTFSNARAWAFLTQVDAAEAQRCRSRGCPHCGAVLHSATYPRKPHGLAPELRDDARRFSLCCADCRRRVKPPSSRFFGRRFRVAPLFVVVNALALAGGARLEAIARQWRIPVLTLRRWRRWWRESFPATRAWRWKRGELAVPSGEAPLCCVLRRIRGRSVRSRLLRTLIWLLPWTGDCALGAGPARSAESGSSRHR